MDADPHLRTFHVRPGPRVSIRAPRRGVLEFFVGFILGLCAVRACAPGTAHAGGPITTGPGITVRCTVTDQVLQWSVASGTWVCSSSTNISGTGTANTIPKFTSADVIGNSTISDNGTTVTVTLNASDSFAPVIQQTGRNGAWQLGMDIANTTPARDFVPVAKVNSYSFEDGVCNGTTTLTSAAQGNFSSAYLVGASISGPGIPGGTTITAVASATSLTMSNTCTTGTGLRVTITYTGVTDFVYVKHRGGRAPVLGVGDTPPLEAFLYGLSVRPDSNEIAMGGIGVYVNASETGRAFDVHDSGTDYFWVKPNGHLDGNGGVTFDSSITTAGDINAGANLRLTQAGTDYIYSSLSLSSGNQSLEINAAGTGKIVFQTGAGGFTNAGTGGLELDGGGSSTTSVWSVTNTGVQTVATTSTASTNLTVNSDAATTTKTVVVQRGASTATAVPSGTAVQVDTASGNAAYLAFSGTGAKGLAFSNASASLDGYVRYDATGRTLELGAANAVQATIDVNGITLNNAKNSGTITLSTGTGTATVRSGAKCVCTDSTANVSVKCAVATTTLTATGTGSDVIIYACF